MNRFFVLTGFGLTISTWSGAQTLDNTSTSITPGDQFTTHRSGTDITIGPGGMGMTWNYSALTDSLSSYLSYVSPANTMYFASFPTATVASVNVDGYTSYYRASAGSSEYLGSASNSHTTVFENSQVALVYPCNYNSTWSDDFSSSADSIWGIHADTADAFGTLIMPYGPVGGVLRIAFAVTFHEVVLGDTLTLSGTVIDFYKPGVHYPLLVSPPSGVSPIWLDGSSVGMEEAMHNAIGVDVFPDPASDHADVVFSSGGSDLDLELFNAAGAIVMRRELNAAPGISKEGLDLGEIAKGLYTVRITDSHGGQGVRRLVVE